MGDCYVTSNLLETFGILIEFQARIIRFSEALTNKKSKIISILFFVCFSSSSKQKFFAYPKNMAIDIKCFSVFRANKFSLFLSNNYYWDFLLLSFTLVFSTFLCRSCSYGTTKSVSYGFFEELGIRCLGGCGKYFSWKLIFPALNCPESINSSSMKFLPTKSP